MATSNTDKSPLQLENLQAKLKAAAFEKKEENKQAKPLFSSKADRSNSNSTPTFSSSNKTFSFTDDDLNKQEEGDNDNPLYQTETTRTSESPFDPYETEDLDVNPESAQQFFQSKLAEAKERTAPPVAIGTPQPPRPTQKATGYSDINTDAVGQGGFASQINSNQQTQNPTVSYNQAGGTPTPTPKNNFNRPTTFVNQNSGMTPFHNRQEYDNTYSGELTVPTNNNPNFVDAYNKNSMIEPVRDNYLPAGFTSNSPVSQTILKSSDAGFGPMSPNMNTNMTYLPTKPTHLAKQQAQDFSNHAVQSVMNGNFTLN